MSALVDAIMAHNRAFVENRDYEQYDTTKFPDKKLAVLACMDTRLTGLLPAAMNFKNGDVKLIKNAGGTVNHPFGSVMRSLLIAVYELQAEEIAVVSHYDCGLRGLDPKKTIRKMLSRGVKRKDIDLINYCGFDLEAWLAGFEDAGDNVRAAVNLIRSHPLMPGDIPVHGFLIDPRTGRLDLVNLDKSDTSGG